MNQQQLQLIDYLRERTECCANNWAKSDYGSTMTSAADWPPIQSRANISAIVPRPTPIESMLLPQWLSTIRIVWPKCSAKICAD